MGPTDPLGVIEPLTLRTSGKMEMPRYFNSLLVSCLLAMAPACSRQPPSTADLLGSSEAGTVVFEGGHETDSRDQGRPVKLIASALNVEEQVFRDAFSGVTPSSFGPPTPSHARENKKILMKVLGKHGVSSERLDEVSNHYRYRPGSGELWTHVPASAAAVIENGKVTSVTITNPGAGYVQPPRLVIAGHERVRLKAKIGFTDDLKTNGHLESIQLVDEAR